MTKKKKTVAKEYVDDINLVVKGKNLNELKKNIQQNYDKISQYLTNYKMVINGAKSQLMVIGKKEDNQKVSITAGGQTISHQNHLKMLGITLSHDQTFDHHLKGSKESVTRKIFKHMGSIKAIRPHVSVKTLSNIGGALINGTIGYAALVWGGATATTIAKVQAAQTKMARVITKDRPIRGTRVRTHRQEIMDKIRWNNVNQIIQTATINMAYNIANKKFTIGLNDTMEITLPGENRRTAGIRMNFKGKATKNSNRFEVRTATSYNQLPDHLKAPGIKK